MKKIAKFSTTNIKSKRISLPKVHGVKRKARQILSLPTDAVLVLQQVLVSGTADLANLSETLNINRKRLAHIVSALRSKGLITIDKDQGSMFVQMSNRGKKLALEIWPEAMAAPA